MRKNHVSTLGLWALAAAACSEGIDPPPPTPAVKIEGGTFTMGGGTYDPCNASKVTDEFIISCNDKVQSELVENRVEVKTFWLDTIEVTNFRYEHCVAVGDCGSPEATQAGDPKKQQGHHKKYYDTETYKHYPVIGVTAEQAEKYCAAQGGRLPTEAEWEFAATSRGDAAAVGDLHAAAKTCEGKGEVGFGSCSGQDVLETGTATADVTAEGVHDMLANAQEWVADTFDYLAYCQASSIAGFEKGKTNKFPRLKNGQPPADVRGPDECLDADDSMSTDFPGKGCAQRLQDCAGQCGTTWNATNARSTAQAQADFADSLCRKRLGAPPEATDCSRGASACDGIDAAAEGGAEQKAACEAFCACSADLGPQAGTNGGECLQTCMQGYVDCAVGGVTNGYETERKACLDASVGFACVDVQTTDGGSARNRMRPICLPRGTDAAPYKAYEGSKNTPHEASEVGGVDGHHVIRGAAFQDADACQARVTRRETWTDVAYSGTVGFRCAYDSDPAAAQ